MSWSLEIHHIDVDTSGDATLIIASKSDGTNFVSRSILVDGGHKASGGPRITKFLNQEIRPRYGESFKVDIVLATHYDQDHFLGLTSLLEQDNREENGYFNNSIVFDQGIPCDNFGIRERWNKSEVKYVISPFGISNDELNYFNSIKKRIHPTKMVKANTKCLDIEKSAGFLEPNFLLGKELLWWTFNNSEDSVPPRGGFYISSYPEYSEPSVPMPIYKSSIIDKNAPTITCIAANGYVLCGDDKSEQNYFGNNGPGEDEKNTRSLALLVEFGNFKYYLGGDLSTKLEDGVSSKHGLMYFLRNSPSKPPITAIKASHHGSDHSTSVEFLKRLFPSTVFISNGKDNQHGHPSEDTIKRIEASKSVKNYFLTAPPPVNREQYMSEKGIISGISNESFHAPGNISLWAGDSDKNNYHVTYVGRRSDLARLNSNEPLGLITKSFSRIGL